ncbi:hypothetical protein AB0I90_21570 [Micromonospora wenchangensis]|uniref:hypothetical protein n=1 Tax=Micromonospora wenchangensis TaxID=1185415 RepID=UPI0033DCF17F
MDRPEHVDRPERADRPERVDRPEHADYPDQEPGDRASDKKPPVEEPAEPLDADEVLRQLRGLFGNDPVSFSKGPFSTGDMRVAGQNATGHGAMAIGTMNVGTVRDGRSARIWIETLKEGTVRELSDAYASTSSDQQLHRRLGQQHLVCLSGPPASGRFTSARLAAARRHGLAKVCLLGGVKQPGDLLASDVTIPGGYGYVLRLDDAGVRAVDGSTLVGLANRAEHQDMTIVLVGDFSRRRNELAGYLVEHRPAAAAAVFGAQLRSALSSRCVGEGNDCDGECLNRYVEECTTHPELHAYLASEPRPEDLAPLVEDIASQVPRGASLRERLARLLPRHQREWAAQILEVEETVEGWSAEQVRAFRVSCAVLAGRPVAEIRQAAWALIEQVTPAPVTAPASTAAPVTGAETGGGPPVGGTRIRGAVLDNLLGVALRRAVQVKDGWTAGGTRIAFQPSNEQLRSVLLEVAWTDWWLPEQLLDWLAGLARAEVPETRQLAAAALGWSAGRDVGAALATVGGLAAEPRAAVRQAAAVAVVAMAVQPALGHRVRAELDKWAGGAAPHLRDTVARAYELGLARLWPDAALVHLWWVAQVRTQRWHNSVVRGLVEVHVGGQPGLLLTTLVDWTRSDVPEARLHAARTLRVLAERWAPPPREHWPELLSLAGQDVVGMADLATLWATALSLPETAYRSWRTLGWWLSGADGQPEVAGRCLDLLRLVITGRPPLRHRLDHQLHHVWRPLMPRNSLLDDVRRLIDEEQR